MFTLRKLAATMAAALAMTAGTLTALSSPAAAASTAPKLSDFVLRPASLPSPSLQERVNRLDAVLPKLGVQNILAQANRTGAWATGSSTACNAATAFPGKTVPPGRRFCWNSGDATTGEWTPQGVTTVADAQADELWGTKQAVLVSWYQPADAGKKGVRISFIDTATNQYQHVLLVYPYINSAGAPTYEAVTSPQSGDGGSLHAGGIVWSGNYLYVADTTQGVRVFDMRYIFDIKSAANGDVDTQSAVGYYDAYPDGQWYSSYGYRYVMPQVDWLVNDAGDAPKDTGVCNYDGIPKFSFLSVDRANGLISGEYCTNSTQYGRVAKWPLDSTGKLVRDSDGKVRATAVNRLPARYIQGATSYNGTWYLSQTGGGDTGTAQLLEAGSSAGLLTVTKARWAGIGSEDLSVWPSKKEVWTVTEHAGKRFVYTCPLTATATGTFCGAGATVR
ncbi:hypothetical protein [Actinoplanes sp. HUAS TT8]|uniref:hypothetical protein n=1 Tax=Actinoplanes sp. HUAS TT8 TaxID=3447453 RepID=UPI003F51E1F4